MNFKTVAEAFNFYKGKTVEELERRAAEIKEQIEKDANVDINALNIELTGIKEAKANLTEKGTEQRGASMNLITGQNQGNKPTFTEDTVWPMYLVPFSKVYMYTNPCPSLGSRHTSGSERSQFSKSHSSTPAMPLLS